MEVLGEASLGEARRRPAGRAQGHIETRPSGSARTSIPTHVLPGGQCRLQHHERPGLLAGQQGQHHRLSITEMGCGTQRHEQDQRLSSFLADVPSWRLDGENLVLRSANTELVLTEEKVRPLVGTTWQADTLVQGEVAGSTPAGVVATLVFGGDEVIVTGLCNLGTLKYQAAGSTLTFELGPLTRMACAPEIMTVENAAVALYDGQATYRIDARTLTITKGGKGLRFTAVG